jgi:autotransporter translocation and assembly factor TamB
VFADAHHEIAAPSFLGGVGLSVLAIIMGLIGLGVAYALYRRGLAPELWLTGRFRLSVGATGTLSAPLWSGEVRLENGKYRVAAMSQIVDDINATVRFAGASGGELEARARVGGGEAFAAGRFGLDGFALKDFRLTLQGRRYRAASGGRAPAGDAPGRAGSPSETFVARPFRCAERTPDFDLALPT